MCVGLKISALNLAILSTSFFEWDWEGVAVAVNTTRKISFWRCYIDQTSEFITAVSNRRLSGEPRTLNPHFCSFFFEVVVRLENPTLAGCHGACWFKVCRIKRLGCGQRKRHEAVGFLLGRDVHLDGLNPFIGHMSLSISGLSANTAVSFYITKDGFQRLYIFFAYLNERIKTTVRAKPDLCLLAGFGRVPLPLCNARPCFHFI